MKREDVRDEALGSLLRGAAEFSARERAGSPKIRTPKLLRPRFSVAHRGIAATAAAAVIIAVLGIPALSRRYEKRVFVRSAVEAFSQDLILEASPLFVELPAISEIEAAAENLSESLFAPAVEL